MTMNPETLKKIVCFKCNQNGQSSFHCLLAWDLLTFLALLGHFGTTPFALPPLLLRPSRGTNSASTANNCNNPAVPGQRGGVERFVFIPSPLLATRQ